MDSNYRASLVSRTHEIDYNRVKNADEEKENRVVKHISSLTSSETTFLDSVRKTLRKKNKPKSSQEVRKYFKTIRQIHGPHVITVIELIKDTCIIVFGEIHQNPDGCRGSNFNVMHSVVIDMMLHIPNMFLILESFFHLWVVDVEHANDICTVLKKRQGSVHSMWNAMKCLMSANERCSVNSSYVGELILLRSFAFLVQMTAAHLKEAGVVDSVIYQLESRIKFMDCREDLSLTPWEWIKGSETEKLETVKSMLSIALESIEEFIPQIHCEDLRNLYMNEVDTPLKSLVQECIKNPSKELYDDIFTKITEFVTLATLFNCLEQYYKEAGHRAQFLIVVGDKHREFIVTLIQRCLRDKIVNTYNFRGDSSSCVNMR